MKGWRHLLNFDLGFMGMLYIFFFTITKQKCCRCLVAIDVENLFLIFPVLYSHFVNTL